MEWNRNKCLMLGLLLGLMGLEFRLVDRFVLNQQTSETLAKYHRSATQKPPSTNGAAAMFQKMAVSAGSAVPTPRQSVIVPAWLGLALIAVGIVLVLQSFVMPPVGAGGGGG
jgi:hypothetical protein